MLLLFCCVGFIIKIYAQQERGNNCTEVYNYVYQMKSWQDCLDSAIEKDSTNAVLWQKKAMPYFKMQKYSIGMPYLDKAVALDEQRWLPYRGFIKCIFIKKYEDAIEDFERCIGLFGNGNEMDHTYRFYIGLSYLQLNDFEKAESVFQDDIWEQEKGMGSAHYLDLFYLGIAKFELGKWEEAIVAFDKSLVQYPQFSEVLFYKSICLFYIGQAEKGIELNKQAQEYAAKGYTINEDNVAYERYPYQLIW
ncbi:MAG: tetratricopeptide repeat protein [Capnocytophaga sp.]|nr:tetratricopeptide repeat protein [Capnocytophaga sp.]